MKKRISKAAIPGAAIGNGLIAGLAGTVAITLSQMIEMKITRRKPGTVPADAVRKVLDVQEASQEDKERFSQEVHWVYGTQWGAARGIISLFGLRGWPATLTHFAAVWGTAMIIEPSLEVAPPLKEWTAKQIVIDGIHHAVYAVVAGLVFDTLMGDD